MKKTTDSSDYLGHRLRLRSRFLYDTESLQDYELLELLLFTAIPRKDTKKVAKDLIKNFKTLPKVFAASHKQLGQIEGVGENTAIFLKAIRELGLRLARSSILNQEIIGSWEKLLAYCRIQLGSESIERFHVLFLNQKNKLILDEVQQIGTVNQVALYPREVIKKALFLDACAIILVHNHPSGDPNPSHQDIAVTKEIVKAGSGLGISVHDHLIITQNAFFSFKQHGLL
jgi:DNA repair protein RadC